MDYRRQWLQLLKKADAHAERYAPPYSQMAAVRLFEEQLALYKEATHSVPAVHYANSTAIRLANIYARHHVWCNRGVNGIEGSLSTAAGFSAVAHLSPLPSRTTPLTFCVIGDLSFFYDQNALWNQSLNGNLRILLLNNGKGGIFDKLPGLEKSPARDKFVAAQHRATAEGICQQNDIYYQQATTIEEMQRGIDLLLSADFSRPMVLEVLSI
jgi:2-succinyl-5-enolpyruvyl-6-hydroxy-3-cyclohexene-1-carboxylate synthase